jgi:3-oxoacyl-[acyl-carrier-protein] synthase-1
VPDDAVRISVARADLRGAPCRPYAIDRDGISVGEGAGFALLERPDDASAPGATLLLGVGESCDAYHMSSPHPEGAGAKLAMRQALASAGLTPAGIDYVNLHGTATKANDASEDPGRCSTCSAAQLR